MNEYLKNLSLTVILCIVLACLMLLTEQFTKQDIPDYLYIVAGVSCGLYVMNRKES